MTIYLHIGFHKTGSTSLQKFFLQNEDALRAQGYAFPKACRGRENTLIHPNVSWELLEARNYDPELGTIADLVREIQTTPDVRDWIITGEGISRLPEPARLLSLLPADRFVVVAFMRDPVSLAPSLYAETLKFGHHRTFSEWIDSDRSQKMLLQMALADRWRLPNVDLRLRPLHQLPSGVSTVAEFVDTLGADPAALDFNLPPQNTRVLYEEAVVMFAINAMLHLARIKHDPPLRRSAHREARKFARRSSRGEGVGPFRLSSDQRALLLRRYGAEAERVLGAPPPDVPPEPFPLLDQETADTLLTAACDAFESVAGQKLSAHARKRATKRVRLFLSGA